jgi:phage terminase small subunit
MSKKPAKAQPIPGTPKSSRHTSDTNHGVYSANALPHPVQSRFSAPPHLRPDTAAWWQAVAADYALEQHQLRILTLSAEAWDRCTEAREALAKNGTTYVDRFQQPRARPEVSIERDSRIAFARLVRELALDLDPPDERGRPPRVGSTASKKPGSDWDDEDRRILGL